MIMAYYNARKDGKARTNNYKFSIVDMHDSSLIHLRADVMRMNMESREMFKHAMMRFGPSSEYTKYKKSYFIRIRARGPRGDNYYDTPNSNANHYDVYIAEKRLMRGYDF